MADPVAAYLDDVAKRYRVFGESDAMPRLLAAVEAALALTNEWDIAAARIAGELEHVSPRNQGARVLLEVRSELRLIQARAVRQAISRALLGEGE